MNLPRGTLTTTRTDTSFRTALDSTSSQMTGGPNKTVMFLNTEPRFSASRRRPVKPQLRSDRAGFRGGGEGNPAVSQDAPVRFLPNRRGPGYHGISARRRRELIPAPRARYADLVRGGFGRIRFEPSSRVDRSTPNAWVHLTRACVRLRGGGSHPRASGRSRDWPLRGSPARPIGAMDSCLFRILISITDTLPHRDGRLCSGQSAHGFRFALLSFSSIVR